MLARESGSVAALKAVDAGVDGLVVEGGEGGGYKNPRDVATMVLLPLVCSRVRVPIIAAGGICDGASMAAAIALGGQVVGRIDAVKPVAQIIEETVAGFRETLGDLQKFTRQNVNRG